MPHSIGGFNHEIEYNHASLFKYLYISIIQCTFVKYYLIFVVHISSEDLVTNISPTYNLHTHCFFFFFFFFF